MTCDVNKSAKRSLASIAAALACLAACVMALATLEDNEIEQTGDTRYVYVATDGDDTSSGAKSSPLATLAGARDLLRKSNYAKPVVVCLRGGTYRQAEAVVFAPQDSGTASAPITYRAYPGEKVTLNGSKVADGAWVDEGDGTYSLSLPAQEMFRTLMINGKVATRARWPSDGKYHLMVSYPSKDKIKDHFYYDQTAGLPADILPTEEVELINYSAFQVSRHLYDRKGATPADDTVAGDGEKKIYVKVTAPNGPGDELNSHSHYGRYFWENSLSFLTDPGEWFFDSAGKKLYYRLKTGEDINTLVAEIGVTETLIDIQGKAAYLPAFVDSFTFSGWFRTDHQEPGIDHPQYGSSYWMRSIFRNNSVNGTHSEFRISLAKKDGNVVIQVRYGKAVVFTADHADLNDNTKHHLAVAFDRENLLIKIYIDCSEVGYDGSNAISPSTIITSDPPWIGSQGGLPWSKTAPLSCYWDGYLYDLAVFGKVLSADAIATIAASETNAEPAGNLAFSMPFDGNFDVLCDTIAGVERESLWWHSRFKRAFHSAPRFLVGGGLQFDGVDDEINCNQTAGVFVEHLRFEGLAFTGVDRADVKANGWSIGGQAHNVDVQGAMRLKFAREIAIAGCDFLDLDSHGVQILDSQDTQTTGCKLLNVGGEGIAIVSDKTRVADDLGGNHLVDGCELRHIGMMLKNGNAIAIGYASNVKVLRTVISDVARGGIKMSDIGSMDKGRGGHEFAYCHLSRCCTEVEDMGAIYVNGVVANSSIHHLTIVDTLYDPLTHGIRRIDDQSATKGQIRGLYMDEGCGNDGANAVDGWDVHDIIIARCSAECLRLHNVWANNFRNNIFVDPLDEGSACVSIAMSGYQDGWDNAANSAFVFKAIGSTFRNNIFYIRGKGDGRKRFTMRIDVSNVSQNRELKVGGKYNPIGDYSKNIHWPDAVGFRQGGSTTPADSVLHNLQWLRDQYGIETDSVVADPRFVDYSHGNYLLRGDSPAIDLGFQVFDEVSP